MFVLKYDNSKRNGIHLKVNSFDSCKHNSCTRYGLLSSNSSRQELRVLAKNSEQKVMPTQKSNGRAHHSFIFLFLFFIQTNSY